MIPYGRHSISEDDIAAVIDALKSDWLTTGPLVEQFENASRNSKVELNDVKMEFEDEGLHAISDKKQKPITDESVTIVKSSRVKNVSEIELEQNK